MTVHNRTCTVCGEAIADLADRRKHSRTAKRPVACDHCTGSFGSVCALIAHINTDHGDQKVLSYACDYCPREFRIRALMEAHRGRHTSRRFPCTKCTDIFAKKTELTAHMQAAHRKRTEIIPKDIVCNTCGKTFKTRSNLMEHTRYAHRKPQFECPECLYTAKFPLTMDHHLRNTHGMTDGVKRRKVLAELFPFQCYVCKSKFLRAQKVAKHMRKAHPMGACAVCDAELATADTTHSCIDRHPLGCDYCPSSFGSVYALSAHLSNGHAAEAKRIFVCDICGRQFHQRLLMEAHRERHTRGSFACSKCDQVFDTKSKRHSHLRSAHTEASKERRSNSFVPYISEFHFFFQTLKEAKS